MSKQENLSCVGKVECPFPLIAYFCEEGNPWNNILGFSLSPPSFLPERNEFSGWKLGEQKQTSVPSPFLLRFPFGSACLQREHIVFCNFILQTLEWQALPMHLEAWGPPIPYATVQKSAYSAGSRLTALSAALQYLSEHKGGISSPAAWRRIRWLFQRVLNPTRMAPTARIAMKPDLPWKTLRRQHRFNSTWHWGWAVKPENGLLGYGLFQR